MKNILSEEDLQNTRGINEEAVKLYIDLAADRLADLLETRKHLDQKAFVLFAGYIAAAFALFGLAERFLDLTYWLVASALILCLGVVLLMIVIRTSAYGTAGRHPEDWLHGNSLVTVDKKFIGNVYAYVLHGYIDRIDISKRSNDSKVFYLNISIVLGFLSLSPLVIRAIFA